MFSIGIYLIFEKNDILYNIWRLKIYFIYRHIVDDQSFPLELPTFKNLSINVSTFCE